MHERVQYSSAENSTGNNMHWRKKEKDQEEAAAAVVYVRLSSAAVDAGGVSDECRDACRVPRGYVPVLVGGADGGPVERFAVHVRLLKDPCIATLLDLGAEEFGHSQRGVLRIPCDVDHFRRILRVISNN